MKKKLFLKNLSIFAAALFCVFQLAGCGDNDPFGPDDNGNNDKDNFNDTLMEDLKDSSKSIDGHTFKADQLTKLDSSLAAFKGKVDVYAGSGRSTQSTRLLVIMTQSIFDQSLRDDVAAYIKSLDTTKRANNLILIVRSLPSVEVNSFTTKDLAGTVTDTVTIANYIQLQEKFKSLIDLVVGNELKHTMMYKDGTDKYYQSLYNNAALAFKAFVKQSTDWKFNPEDIAIVAFDPIVSSVAVQLALGVAQEKQSSPKVTGVYAVTPVIAFQAGKKYTGTMDSTYANVTYKNEPVISAGGQKYAFNVLRKDQNFLKSLVGGLDFNLLTKHGGSKDSSASYNFIVTDDSAQLAENDIKGNRLVLKENVTDNTVGMSALANKVKDINYSFKGADHNFPTTQQDKDALIKADSTGLVKLSLK